MTQERLGEDRHKASAEDRGSLRSARLLVAMGCSLAVVSCRSPASPSVALTGAWDYSFSAVSPATCPGPFAPTQGCGGVGRLQLVQVDTTLDGSYTERGGCQTCGDALDWGGPGPLTDAELSGRSFAFSTNGRCRFTTPVPDGMVDTVHGVVSCILPGTAIEAHGTLTMTRASAEASAPNLMLPQEGCDRR